MDEMFRTRFDPTRQQSGPGTSPVPDVGDGEANEEVQDHSQAFSLVSPDRRQKLMLELRFKTGNATALAYSYLVSVTLDPSQALVMDFSGYEVTLSGQNLRPLFAALVAQRVAVVRETDGLHAEALLPQGVTVVTGIEVTPRG